MSYKTICHIAAIESFSADVTPKDYPIFFTDREIKKYATKKSKGSLAARYFLKILIIKNLEPGLTYTDIEIINHTNDTPKVTFMNNIIADQKNMKVSISHEKKQVAVLLVIEE